MAQRPALCHPGSTKYTQPPPRTLVRHPGGVCCARTDKAPLLQPTRTSSPASPARHFLRVRSMSVRVRTCPYVSVRVRFLVRMISGVCPVTARLLPGYCPVTARRCPDGPGMKQPPPSTGTDGRKWHTLTTGSPPSVAVRRVWSRCKKHVTFICAQA